MPYDTEISHRGYNIKCKWWSRVKNSFDFNSTPNGFFFAKEETDKIFSRDYFAGNPTVLMQRDTINIKTPDNLLGIKIDDAVEFDGGIWFVANIQRTKARNQQSEYTKPNFVCYYWHLSLRK